jgi:Zn-dependent protease with chaperone function
MSDEVSAAEETTRPSAGRPAWLSALETTVTGGELSRKYRLGLVLVAAAMVLLPLAYLALIGLAGWLLWWHATANAEIFQGSFRFGLFYAAPLVIGGIGFLFMFKPLLARRPEEAAAVSLRAEEQPLLFSFVERLCTCLEAPVPQQIDVHVDPASTGAGFRRGLLSVWGGDMALRISLPLVEALSLREFAGTLAHELGHCRQGAAMRAGHVIVSINVWLHSAVFVPDGWDHRLHIAAQRSPVGLVRAVALIAQVFVFITRLLLLVLMIVGALISGFLSRQMELDADRYLVGVAGSPALRQVLVKGHTLMLAWQLVHEGLQRAWFDGRLADDLPSLVMIQMMDFAESPEGQQEFEAAVLSAKAGPFDTHPAPADRLAHADREAASGLALPATPAAELFGDFRGLCRAATRVYYEQVLGAEFSRVQLIDTDVIARERAEQYEADRTLYRYFQGQLLGHVELFLPEGWLAPPADVEQAIRALRQARQGMHAALPQLTAALEQFERAETQRCQAFSAQLLQAAHVRFKPADLSLASGDVVAIGRAQEEGWQAREQALADLQGFVRQAETRLTTALCLLHADAVAGKINDAEALPRVARLNSVLGDLGAAWPHVQPLREHLYGLGLLMSRVEENSRNQAYWTELKRVAVVVHDLLGKLRDALATTPYPFDHAAGDIRVSEYLLQEIPPAEHVGELAVAAEELLARLLALYFRAMAQLAVTAERVEAALGLPRLPDPPEPDGRRR